MLGRLHVGRPLVRSSDQRTNGALRSSIGLLRLHGCDLCRGVRESRCSIRHGKVRWTWAIRGSSPQISTGSAKGTLDVASKAPIDEGGSCRCRPFDVSYHSRTTHPIKSAPPKRKFSKQVVLNSEVCILGTLQRQVDSQGVFVKIGDFIKFKGLLVEFLENRRS